MPLAIKTPPWTFLLAHTSDDDSLYEACHWRPERETKVVSRTPATAGLQSCSLKRKAAVQKRSQPSPLSEDLGKRVLSAGVSTKSLQRSLYSEAWLRHGIAG